MAFDRIDPSDQIPDADLLEQQIPLDPSQLTDAEPSPGITALPADPLMEAAVRLYADFAERATLAEVLATVACARRDLDTPSAAALPEMIERLARQRLADGVASATSNGSTPAEHRAEPLR